VTCLLLGFQILPFVLGGLLRTPRVYNTLLSSSENLTPSRTFPVLQPVLHDGFSLGYTLSPFSGISGYGPYLPAHVELQPYDPHVVERPKQSDSNKHQPHVEIIHRDIPPLPPNELHGPLNKHHARPLPPVEQEQHQPKRPLDIEIEKPHGLPPSLIPLQQYQIHDTIPIGYTSVPQLYYPYQLHTNFSPYPVLPPEFFRPSSPQPPVQRHPTQAIQQNERTQSKDDKDKDLDDSEETPSINSQNSDRIRNAEKNSDSSDEGAPSAPASKKGGASL
ncbi:uncharacterized protein LOC113381906, partial [Ctenocephalides felis]|uniref:uncharacterized protein LOC113381906 n=1 Tax=Ctenocephalides felis TaxID=7515 RepID=UPI000E6E49B2